MDIQGAAQSLLSKKQITQKEYNALEKVGFMKNAGAGAFLGRTADRIGRAAWPLMLIPTAMASIGAVAVDPIVTSAKIRSSYKKLKEKTPQLKGVSDEVIKDYFNVVKTFSPKSASNPLVAGALVNKMVEFGGVDHKLVQDLSSIDKNLNPVGISALTGMSKSVGVNMSNDVAS